jgi:hypothetical protein
MAGIFLARVMLLNLAGFLFNKITVFREYLYNSLIFSKLLGVGLLPLLLFAVYTSGILQEVFFWLTSGTVIIVFLMRLIRSAVFSFRKDVSIFYMFLYLCALEIVPLMLLYKWLEGIL